MTIKYLLACDVETTGLDEKKGNLLEIGAALFHVPTKSIVAQVSTLLSANENPAEHINLISVPMLQASVKSVEANSVQLISTLINQADVLVAHNAVFDRAWLEAYSPLQHALEGKKWFCTRKNVTWPGSGGLKLQHIAQRMGVPYVDAHRSLPDVHIMLECLKRLPDLEQQLNLFDLMH